MLTAIPVEYLAVREHLAGPFLRRVVSGTRYEVATFRGAHRVWTVAIAEIGASNNAAAVHLERARWAFSPSLALFVGVAGGRGGVRLGDVVVASEIYGYESGRDGAEYWPRIKTLPAPHELVQLASHVARGDWHSFIKGDVPVPAPTAHVKPLAAGEKVVADEGSATGRLIERNAGDALGVEMEGFGFLKGAYMGSLRALVVRGISDLLSGKTAQSDGERQPIAARHAAAFAFALLHESESPDPEFPRSEISAESPRDAEPSGLGATVFSAQIPDPRGPLAVAFGAGGTLVVTEHNARVHRWALDDGAQLTGLPHGPDLRTAERVVTSTTQLAVAVVRDKRLTITHFEGESRRTLTTPLGDDDFLVPISASVVATYGAHRVVVRDYSDGSPIWEHTHRESTAGLATAAISQDGSVIATATSRTLEVTREYDRTTYSHPIRNWPMAGCMVRFNPAADLIACATFQELVVLRVDDQQIVHRRNLSFKEARAALGAKWSYPLCLPDGDLLWFAGQRIAHIAWPDPALHFLPQDGVVHDATLDPTGTLLATVNTAGQVTVRRWRSGPR